LVFNTGFAGKVLVDDTVRTVTNGVLTITLPAGKHQVKKSDTANLYYIQLTYPTDLFTVRKETVFLSHNPVDELVEVMGTTTIFRVECLSLDGTVQLLDLSENKVLNVSVLRPGFYLLRVYTPSRVHVVRMLKR